MSKSTSPVTVVPLMMNEQDEHWLSGVGQNIVRSFLNEVSSWEISDERIVVSNNDVLARLGREAAFKTIAMPGTPVQSSPCRQFDDMEFMSPLLHDHDRGTAIIMLDFRLQGITRKHVEQALHLHAEQARPVFGMVEPEDHPCQIQYCDQMIDSGSLHRLDPTYKHDIPGRVATREFPLPPGLFSKIPPQGSTSTIECNAEHHVFQLSACRPDPEQAVAWRMTQAGQARLLIRNPIPGQPILDAVNAAAVTETGDIQCRLVSSPTGERLRLDAAEEQDVFLQIWPRCSPRAAAVLFRCETGDFDFSTLPDSPVYDFMIYKPAINAAADWIRPVSLDNCLWYQDAVTLKVHQKHDNSVIFGRQAFPGVGEPHGIAVFAAGQCAGLSQALRTGNGLFLDLPFSEIIPVNTMVDLLKCHIRKKHP